MSTYRERREARAERLREWADKRETKASAAFERADQIAGMIPFGQPILVGHHSEGRHRRDVERIGRGMTQGVEHSRTAERMRERAANIDAAADRAIYSDDPDAIERLRDKLAGLEAERARIKAYNASCRKGARDLSLLDEAQQAKLLSIAEVCAYQLGAKGEMPAYVASNLSGVITSTRKRLAALEG